MVYGHTHRPAPLAAMSNVRQNARVKFFLSRRTFMRIWRGSPYPLGATWDGGGVNVAVFSEYATRVELCLFDSVDAKQESERIALPERTYQVWHGYYPDLRPGQLYGLRVEGPYEPAV